MDTFFITTRMKINNEKSMVLTNALEADMLRHLAETMQYGRKSIDDGLTYLGFELKPNSYSYDD